MWSPAKSKRFKDELRHTFEKPEPCTYNPSDTHSMNDSYILSTFKNPGIKRIIPTSIARTAGNQGIYRRNGKYYQSLLQVYLSAKRLVTDLAYTNQIKI